MKRVKMEKLKRCPFCGGEGQLRKYLGSEQAYYVRCSNGDVLTQTFATPETAARKWNTRVTGTGKNSDVLLGCILQSNADAHETEEEIRR